MDEKIITQFEVNILANEESTESVKKVFAAVGATIVAEKPVTKIRLSYDIKKQQYAFFATFEISIAREDEKKLRKELASTPSIMRVMITEKITSKEGNNEQAEPRKKQSRLKSALQAMLPNEALEKKIEEILQ